MTASILSSHRTVAPFGLAGGQSGSMGNNWVQRVNGDEIDLGNQAQVDMETGDRLIIETPGGGGYGEASTQRPGMP